MKKNSETKKDSKQQFATFQASTRNVWRNWLVKNHESNNSIWLVIYHKNSKVKSITYDEAVEEALCFGWIDSKPNKRDEQSYILYFSKRKPKSNWSQSNKIRVAKLIEKGQMMPSGLVMVDLAKKTGTWDALNDVQNSVIPDDLQKALNLNPLALKYFSAFTPASKRAILEWILNAKRSETREKRIEETVKLAAKNIKANQYRQ